MDWKRRGTEYEGVGGEGEGESFVVYEVAEAMAQLESRLLLLLRCEEAREWSGIVACCSISGSSRRPSALWLGHCPQRSAI